jgi:hypothetical protein
MTYGKTASSPEIDLERERCAVRKATVGRAFRRARAPRPRGGETEGDALGIDDSVKERRHAATRRLELAARAARRDAASARRSAL